MSSGWHWNIVDFLFVSERGRGDMWLHGNLNHQSHRYTIIPPLLDLGSIIIVDCVLQVLWLACLSVYRSKNDFWSNYFERGISPHTVVHHIQQSLSTFGFHDGSDCPLKRVTLFTKLSFELKPNFIWILVLFRSNFINTYITVRILEF